MNGILTHTLRLLRYAMPAVVFGAAAAGAIQALASTHTRAEAGVALLGGLLPGWSVALFGVTLLALAIVRAGAFSPALRIGGGRTTGAPFLRLARTATEGAVAGVCMLALLNPATVPVPVVLLDLSEDRRGNVAVESDRMLHKVLDLKKNSALGLDFHFLEKAGGSLQPDAVFGRVVEHFSQRAASPGGLTPQDYSQWHNQLACRKSPPVSELLAAYHRKLASQPYGQALFVVSIDRPTQSRTQGLYPVPLTRGNSCRWIPVLQDEPPCDRPKARSLVFTQSPRRRPSLKFTFQWPDRHSHFPAFEVRFLKDSDLIHKVDVLSEPDRHALAPLRTAPPGYTQFAAGGHMAFTVDLTFPRSGEFDRVQVAAKDLDWNEEFEAKDVDPRRQVNVYDAAGACGKYRWLALQGAPGITFTTSASTADIVWIGEADPPPDGKPWVRLVGGHAWIPDSVGRYLQAADSELTPALSYQRGWCDYAPVGASARAGEAIFLVAMEKADGTIVRTPVAWREETGSVVVLPGGELPLNQQRGLYYMLRATSSLTAHPDLVHERIINYDEMPEESLPLNAGTLAHPENVFASMGQALRGARDDDPFQIPPTSLRPTCLAIALGYLLFIIAIWAVGSLIVGSSAARPRLA